LAEVHTWLSGQVKLSQPNKHPAGDFENLRATVAAVRPLFGAGSEELGAMDKQMAETEAMQASIEAVLLQTRRMKPDAYYGADVEEWADTSKTVLRVRTIRGVYAPVAARQGDKCFLHTIFLGQDTIAGTTNPLTGHIMYTEGILEKNL